MTNYYDQWLRFKKDEDNINHVKNRVLMELTVDDLSLYDLEKEPYKTKLVNTLFNRFCKIYSIPGNDVYDCILLNFPLSTITPFLEQFARNPYNIKLNGCKELTKLIYHLWPKYMGQNWFDYNKHYPHGDVFEILQSIKIKLERLEKVTSEQYGKLLGSRYYAWSLLGCIPLLKNGENIMWNVIKLKYDDAQEMLIFGLSQFDPVRYLPTLGKIFRYWDTHQNIELDDSGTGIVRDIFDLVHHYKKQGIDIYSDPNISDILENSHNKLLHKTNMYRVSREKYPGPAYFIIG
jgi:hypothetical protein